MYISRKATIRIFQIVALLQLLAVCANFALTEVLSIIDEIHPLLAVAYTRHLCLEMEIQVCGFGITERIGLLQECFSGFKVVARDAGAEALQTLHDGCIGIRTTIAAEFA